MAYRLMWVLLNERQEILQKDGSWVKEGLVKGKVALKHISTTNQTVVFKNLFKDNPDATQIHEVQSDGENYVLKGFQYSR